MRKKFKILLWPFSFLFGGITTFRNFLYDKRILPSHRFKLPVVVVGNLSTGGTGKSPHVEYLVKMLKEERVSIAVLSRGYGRKTGGFLLADQNSRWSDIGDEPLMIYRKNPDINVAVDGDRVRGIKKLLKIIKPDVVILDDAMQHRSLEGSFYILLTQFRRPFFEDHLLPLGDLRESRRGARRADVVIVTKCPEALDYESKKEFIQKVARYTDAPVFFSRIEYADYLYGKSMLEVEDIRGREVLLITGIADTYPLKQYMDQSGAIYRHLKFPDHHSFSPDDLKRIQQEFLRFQTQERIIVTTEKDFARLEHTIIKDLPLYYLPITVEVDPPGGRLLKKELFRLIENAH